MHGRRAVIACVDIAPGIVGETQKESAGHTSHFLKRPAVKPPAIELARFPAGIGTAVRSPGDGLGMIERVSGILQFEHLRHPR
jgi:hypothetical protein